MIQFLGGQTIWDCDKNKPVIFVDYDEEEYYIVFDGNTIIKTKVPKLSHIFHNNPSDIFRTLYSGKYCTSSLNAGINEKGILKIKKQVSRYLSVVEQGKNNGDLYVKNINNS